MPSQTPAPRARFVALALLLALPATPMMLGAQKVASVIVIDVRKSKPGVVTIEKDPQNILAFQKKWAGNSSCLTPAVGDTLPKHLRALAVCLAPAVDSVTGAVDSKSLRASQAAASRISEIADKHAKDANLRAIAAKGDTIVIILLQRASLLTLDTNFVVRGGYSKLRIAEKARESQIQTDSRSLARIAIANAGGKGPSTKSLTGTPSVTSVTWATTHLYVLQRGRSTLTVQTTTETPEVTTLATTLDSANTDSLVARATRRAAETALTQAALTAIEAERRLRHSAESVDTVHGDGIIDGLVALLADSMVAQPVRVAAASALGAIGSPRAIRALDGQLDRSSTAVAEASANALGKIGAATRAVIPVSAGWTEGNNDVAIASLAGGPKAASIDTIRATLLTGPREHWFLSADVPLSDSIGFKFDEDKKAFNGVEAPSSFYIGINYLVGDLQSEDRGFWENFVIRGMVSASKRPAESLGLGLAYRGKPFKNFGLDFDLISPFAAITWTRKELQDASGNSTGVTRVRGFRLGVSLNIDSAVQWVSGDK